MTNDIATTYAKDPNVIAGLLNSIEEAQRRIDADTRQMTAHVSRLRAGGCSWDAIGKRLGISKQAAQQRFVRYCAVEYLEDWKSINGSGGKLVYWTRKRSDKSRLVVSRSDEGGWRWLYRDPNNDVLAEGTAGTVAAAKRAAEAAVGAN